MKSTKHKSHMSLQLPTSTTPSSSLPPSPGPSILLSSVHSTAPSLDQRRTLLMPTVRRPRLATAHNYGSRVTRANLKHHASPKLSRTKHAMSVPNAVFEPEANPWDAIHWFHSGCKFEVVTEHLELEGFQLYAVEKWVTEGRPVTVLAVYTGDPSHKITVTALSPASNLTLRETEAEWQRGLNDIRRDGARPRETEYGTLMVTSLANFRSDFTIVHLPSGNFLDAREQLYVNINLLRMGCSGRGALTLQEPSETIKERFIQTYHLSDKVLTSGTLQSTVLELIKTIQTGLAIYGLFDLSLEERNGLLCDVTVAGIRNWITQVGGQLLKFEPSERVADPAMVASLLSSIIVARNKLTNVGYNHLVPKDPFLEPQALLTALYAFHHHGKSGSPDTAGVKSDVVHLSYALLQAIDTAFEKSRHNEAYKVHKVLFNKLDDLATDLRSTTTEKAFDSGSISGVGTASPLGTRDIGTLAKVLLSGGKDGAQSLSLLWAGKAVQLDRRQKDIVSDAEDDKPAPDARSTDDERDVFGNKPWSGRMQKKIESWAGLHRKKQSMDVSGKTRSIAMDSTDTVQPAPGLPTVVINDEDSNFATSPTQYGTSAHSSIKGEEGSDATSQHDRLLSEFNRQRPMGGYQSRVSSWSDPFSARDMLEGEEQRSKKRLRPSRLGYTSVTANLDEDAQTSTVPSTRAGSPVDELSGFQGRPWDFGRQRRHSFTLGDTHPDFRVLPIERMRIDVDLCGQLLVLRRREQHLGNVVACLEVLTSALASANRTLHNQHQEFQQEFAPLEARTMIVSDIERQRSEVDAMTQDANALSYESAQFRAADIWQLANHSRMKVFGMRSKVFGTGRRVRQGVHGAHGRYTHLQWTLDGEGRLVDQLGRTESEAEEEEGLPRVGPRLVEEQEETDVVPNPSMRPTWLLRFFHSWRARWRAGYSGEVPEDTDASAPSTRAQSPASSPVLS